MSDDTAPQVVALGLGTATMLVPTGWTTIQVDGGLVDGRAPGLAAPLAGGVTEQVARPGFATSVLVSVAAGDLDLPAEALGPGQVGHDSTSPGPLSRVVVRWTEALGVAITSLHAWTSVEGIPVNVVATMDSDRLDRAWPVVLQVLESITPGSDRWEVLS